MHAFDRATHLERAPGDRFRADLDAGWCIGGVPNGGYQLAVVARALCEAADRPDPLVVTGYFLQRAEAGPATVEAEILRRGWSLTTAAARLVQGSERTRVLATLGDLDRQRGPTWSDDPPPDLPPPGRCMYIPPIAGVTPPIQERLEVHLAPSTAGWANGRPSGRPEVAGWVRLSDGRPLDLPALVLISDALPPAVFDRYGMLERVPTLDLTVQLRARPAPGRLRFRFRTRWISGGMTAEDGVLWDETGAVVATSRQSALLPGNAREPS